MNGCDISTGLTAAGPTVCAHRLALVSAKPAIIHSVKKSITYKLDLIPVTTPPLMPAITLCPEPPLIEIDGGS